jgi:hypothetical protein
VTQKLSAELNTQELACAGFWTWVSRDESIRASRSKYGKHAVQMTASNPAPAQFFNRVVDQEAVGQLVQEIAELRRRKIDGQAPLSKLIEELKESDNDRDQIAKDAVSPSHMFRSMLRCSRRMLKRSRGLGNS